MASDKQTEKIAALEEEVADLKQQLAAAHTDRLQAESDRDAAQAVVAPPIEKREVGELHCTIQIPDDLDQYKGEYVELATGEIFGLKIVDKETVRGDKTYHVKNKTHFADYTAEEFRARFDKK